MHYSPMSSAGEGGAIANLRPEAVTAVYDELARIDYQLAHVYERLDMVINYYENRIRQLEQRVNETGSEEESADDKRTPPTFPPLMIVPMPTLMATPPHLITPPTSIMTPPPSVVGPQQVSHEGKISRKSKTQKTTKSTKTKSPYSRSAARRKLSVN